MNGVQARPIWRRWRWWLGGVALLALSAALAAAWLLQLLTWEHRVGFFAPAFSADSKAVVFIERRTRGVTWGFGWEHLTPPAKARAWSDVFFLRRFDLASGDVATLETWERSPIVGRTLSNYRGRMFVRPSVALRPRADGIEYRVELAPPRVPTSEVMQLRGVSADGAQRRRGEWGTAAAGAVGPSEPTIDGERELFTLAGAQSYPAAIVLLDHADRSLRVLQRAPGFESEHPQGPSLDALLAASRKPEHDFVAEMKRIEAERRAAYLALGMNEGAAILRASRDLRDLGYFTKPQRWVATLLAPSEIARYPRLPRLDIVEMEFKVGLFPDLEQAMTAPGTEVDRGFSRYIRHRDFDNSEKLNTLLAADTRELLIGRGGRVYHFRLLPAEPATRSARPTQQR